MFKNHILCHKIGEKMYNTSFKIMYIIRLNYYNIRFKYFSKICFVTSAKSGIFPNAIMFLVRAKSQKTRAEI